MEVKIGLVSVPRELVVDVSLTREQVEEQLRLALAPGGGLLELADRKGGKILVPADKVVYVEFGSTAERRVGFGASAAG